MKSTPKYIWLLLLIVLVGIFLRIYNFKDWLTFNPDQARDAMLIEKALQNTNDIPLLGPEAGNTHFQLGPIFYWFEYISAKTFGNNPEAMAYPDLIFSIFTIILFYFFVKKYFSVNISLALTALLSISFFAVRYSRFAMNTNSIPFWTLLFLFGILEMLDPKNKKNLLWPVATGVALGVGIQLHAILLIGMPLLSLFVLYLLIKRKSFTWQSLVIIILFCLILNIGQIIYDIQYHGANFHLLISSASQKSGGNNFLRNLGMNAAYQIQSGTHMLSSLGNQNDCDFIKIINRIIKNKEPYLLLKNKIAPVFLISLSLIFWIGGYLLLFCFLRREHDQNKKNFLLLISVYAIILFCIMLPIINEASIRYFVVLLFLPFIFLGLWMRFIMEKNRKIGLIFYITITTLFLFSNLFTIKATANKYQSKSMNSMDNSTLGEDEIMLNHLIDNSNSSKEIYLAGKNLYLIRFYKPLFYLAEKKGINIIRIFSDKEIRPGIPLFYIKDSEEKNIMAGKLYKSHIIKDVKKYKNIMVLNFEN